MYVHAGQCVPGFLIFLVWASVAMCACLCVCVSALEVIKTSGMIWMPTVVNIIGGHGLGIDAHHES